MSYARCIRIASTLGLALSLLAAASNVFLVITAPGDWAQLDVSAGSTTYFTFAGTASGKGIGLLALLLDTSANVLFWIALLGLGRRLDGTLSDTRLADAFRRLALGFGGFVLLRGSAIAVLLGAFWAFGGRAQHGLTIGHTGLLLGGLAGVVAWCVARLLGQAADMAAENAGFV